MRGFLTFCEPESINRYGFQLENDRRKYNIQPKGVRSDSLLMERGGAKTPVLTDNESLIKQGD